MLTILIVLSYASMIKSPGKRIYFFLIAIKRRHVCGVFHELVHPNTVCTAVFLARGSSTEGKNSILYRNSRYSSLINAS